jgi:hypothetical protein
MMASGRPPKAAEGRPQRQKLHNDSKIFLKLSAFEKLMFFSFDRLVTRNQILNTKCELHFFVIISIWKKIAWPSTAFLMPP